MEFKIGTTQASFHTEWTKFQTKQSDIYCSVGRIKTHQSGAAGGTGRRSEFFSLGLQQGSILFPEAEFYVTVIPTWDQNFLVDLTTFLSEYPSCWLHSQTSFISDIITVPSGVGSSSRWEERWNCQRHSSPPGFSVIASPSQKSFCLSLILTTVILQWPSKMDVEY